MVIILGHYSFNVGGCMKAMSENEELIELKRLFRDLVEGCKYLCQCDTCRSHRARDFKDMRKTHSAMAKGLVNWAGKMVKMPETER